jgi:uracil-DNA glycosylase family 4
MADLNPEEALAYLRWNRLGNCTRCDLCRKRKQVVFGEGLPEADVLVVRGAPTEADDKAGEPFQGRHGQLLTWFIEQAGLTREQVYTTSIVKCLPPDGRDPDWKEIGACSSFLHGQVWLIKPRIIVALGQIAGHRMSKQNLTMNKLREGKLMYTNPKTKLVIPVIATYPMAHIIRKKGSISERQAKQSVVNDFKRVAKYLSENPV